MCGLRLAPFFAVPFGVVYIVHMSYLCLAPHFDYGWNIIFNAAIIGVLLPVWVLRWWATRGDGHPFAAPNTRPHTWKAIAFCVMLPICAACEILDMAPFWDSLDMHAIWHLLTVPLGALWGSFVIDECRHDVMHGATAWIT